MNSEIVKTINQYLSAHKWCDFEIVKMEGDLIIGGTTSFSATPDFAITFVDVFFIQCLTNWRTNTSSDSFFIPEIDERRELNFKYGVEIGYTLFKILPEDVDGTIYISAKGVVFNVDEMEAR